MASVILLYTNDKHEISKEACKLLNSNLENSGHKIFMVPFKNFRKVIFLKKILNFKVSN